MVETPHGLSSNAPGDWVEINRVVTSIVSLVIGALVLAAQALFPSLFSYQGQRNPWYPHAPDSLVVQKLVGCK